MASSLDSDIKESSVDIAKADRDVMYEAIENEDVDTVKEVLNRVPEIVTTLSDRYFCFYLHLACMNNQAIICEELLRYGADVNQNDDQHDTPLHVAVNHEADIELIQILLSHGADVSSKNKQQMTPFHKACISGSHEYIAELVKYAKGPLSETDVYGRNGLHLALQNWNIFETDEALLDSIKLIVNSGVDLNWQDDNGWTALHYASCRLGFNFIPHLLEIGVNPFLQDCFGDTYFTGLAEKIFQTEFNINLVDLIERLKNENHGMADLTKSSIVEAGEKFINLQNLSGKSILHLSIKYIELSTLKLLLDEGANVCLADNVGNTPLHSIAFVEDGHEKINLLIRYGGKINSRDVHGRIALFEVIECNAAQILIDNGSDPNSEDKLGMGPLHAAALDHRTDIVKTLLQNGALVNKQDRYGSTALHYASWWNFQTVIDLLKTCGADINIKDHNGNTAAQVQLTNQVANSFRIQKILSPDVQQSGSEFDNLTLGIGNISGIDYSNSLLSTPRLGLLSDVGEVCHVKEAVFDLVNKLMCYVTKLDARFKGSLFPTGSSTEGTRVREPDEFDFLYYLEVFGEECDIVEIYYYLIEGFVQLKANDTNSSCAQYFDGNGRLDGERVRYRMMKLLEVAVNQRQMWESNELFFITFTDDSLKPVLNLEVKYIGSFFKALEISIDIVPAIYKKPWWPSTVVPDTFKLMTSTIRDAGCAILLQSPGIEFPTIDNNENFMRISSAPAEIALFKLLPAYVKKSYALIKVLLSGDVCPPVKDISFDKDVHDFSAGYYISSYMVKNCILHEVAEMEHSDLALLTEQLFSGRKELTLSSEEEEQATYWKNVVDFKDLYEGNNPDIISTVTFAKKTLLRLQGYVEKGNLPAYFMSSVNVLGFEYLAVYGEEPVKAAESIHQKQRQRKLIISNMLDFFEKCQCTSKSK